MTYEEYVAEIERLIVKSGWCDEDGVKTWIGGRHLWREFYKEDISAFDVACGECNGAADQHS